MNQKSKASFSWRIIESQCALFTGNDSGPRLNVFFLFKKKGIKKRVCVLSLQQVRRGEKGLEEKRGETAAEY